MKDEHYHTPPRWVKWRAREHGAVEVRVVADVHEVRAHAVELRVEPELLRDGRALLELRLRARDGVLPGAFEPMFVRTCFLTSLLFSANVKRKVLGCIEADFCK